MEKMDLKNLFGGIYYNKKVLITGHTGFKGSWMTYWLTQMGAEVFGLSLNPPTQPNHYDLLNLNFQSYIQDIGDLNKVKEIFQEINPDIIFHLAAQSLVRISYQDPISTYLTNVIGTMNILEASKNLSNLKAVVVITRDKCYENKEWLWGYRENESLGGKDPYSSSKACAELVTAAYRDSFFSSNENRVLIASARAGNVIGGGDWAKDRILTDIISAVKNSKSVYLRFPGATRPWQYVLEALSGYLTLGWHLLLGKNEFANSWNFGPNNENNVSVLKLVEEAQKSWSKINFNIDDNINPHEAGSLMLDSTKAIKLLKWQPVWGFNKTVMKTISWYKNLYENQQITTESTIKEYILDAQKKNIPWSQI